MIKTLSKALLYILSAVIIIYGIYCGISFFKEVTAQGYERGSISISNEVEQLNFSYSTNQISFYEANNCYKFKVELPLVKDFDANKKNYELYINSQLQPTAVIDSGQVLVDYSMRYRDTNGSIMLACSYVISINFINDKTTLNITTMEASNAELMAKYLEQYVAIYGLTIEVKEVK